MGKQPLKGCMEKCPHFNSLIVHYIISVMTVLDQRTHATHNDGDIAIVAGEAFQT